jgi:cytochrome b
MSVEKIPGPARATVRAWDLPTRLFHWSLVLLIFWAWLSREIAASIGDDTLLWHRWNGYAILVLLVFRVLWGFAGSSTSRFTAFIHWPWRALGYLRDLLMGKERRYLGHNPLGTWMIIALLLAVAAQAILGMYLMDDDGFLAGPLKRTISDELATTMGHWHIRWFNVILALVAIHVVANLGYALIKREPLIRAMITGRKPAGPYQDAPEAAIVSHSNLRALICLIAAAGIVYGGVIGLGGKF